jgi:hypothetical protein
MGKWLSIIGLGRLRIKKMLREGKIDSFKDRRWHS